MVAVSSAVVGGLVGLAGAGINAGMTSSSGKAAKNAARDAKILQQTGAQGIYQVNLDSQAAIAEKMKQLSQAVYDKSISAGSTVVEAQRKAQQATYQAQQEAVRASTADNTRSQDQIYTQALSDIGKIYGVQVEASRDAARSLSEASTGARDAQVAASREGQSYLSGASRDAMLANINASSQERGVQAGASRDAMLAKLNASNISDQQYKDAYAKIEAGFTPYTDAGLAALMGQQDLLGMNGTQAQTQAFQGIEGGQYKELAKQGEDALLQNASATGGVRGGNVAGALAQFRPSMLQALIDKQFNNLSGIRDTGYNAQGKLAGYQSNLGEDLATGARARGGFTAENDINQGNIGAKYYTDVGRFTSENDINQGQYGAQSAADIGGFNAQDFVNQGNISAQDVTNRGQYGAEAATSRGIAANTRLTNLNQINQAEINARLQYFVENQGATRDIENENILRSLGYDLDLLAGQYGADINKTAQGAQSFADYMNTYTGAGVNAAQTTGNINANTKLGIGQAISKGFGGLAGALSSYQSEPQIEQPTQYGFAGLRTQPQQMNFNQGQPTSGFWSK